MVSEGQNVFWCNSMSLKTDTCTSLISSVVSALLTGTNTEITFNTKADTLLSVLREICPQVVHNDIQNNKIYSAWKADVISTI